MDGRNVHYCRFKTGFTPVMSPKYEQVKELVECLLHQQQQQQQQQDKPSNNKNELVRSFMYNLKKCQLRETAVCGSCVLTIAYTFTDDGWVHYGTSLFRKESDTEIFLKTPLRNTALRRLQKNPRKVNIGEAVKLRREREKALRKHVYNNKKKNTLARSIERA